MFQVAAIYAAVAWVIVQVADVIGPAINMPNWVMTAIVGFAMVGFPIAVILAWLFDVGPKGVVRTKPGSVTGILAIVVSLGLLGAGTAGFVWLIKPGQQAEGVALESHLLANSVAVMPFVDLSPNKDAEHLSDGIAQVLIHQLSMIAKLKVIASKSSFAFDREDTDYSSIARKLRAERLLVGSVQRSGDRIRISTQLIDSSTGESVWSELFDREGGDVFAIQDEIALTVAENMDAPLGSAIKERITRVITDNLDAYELYLLGTHHMRISQIDDGYATSIEYFEKAVALDPDLALAWAGLASTTFWHGTRGYISFDEGLRRSREYVARALEIDPELGEAHAHAGFLLGSIDRDLDAARQAFSRASEYSPNYWLAYLLYGLTLNNHGLEHEAAEVLAKGLELQPYEPEPLLRVNLGTTYTAIGEYDKGMRLIAATYKDQKGTNLEGQYIAWLALAAVNSQRFDEAVAFLEIAIGDGHESAKTRASLAEALLGLGDLDSAAREIERAEEIVAQEQAEGRSMHTTTAHVLLNRLQVDTARNDVEGLLATKKDLMTKIDAGADDQWAWFDIYQAGLITLILGNHDEGSRIMDQLIDHLGPEGNDAENYALAAYAHMQIGNPEQAQVYLVAGRNLVAEELNDWQDSAGHLTMVALFEAADGKVDAAVEMLQGAYDIGYRNPFYLFYMPPFEVIRNDPRFVELVRQMRADTALMRERVEKARATGDWESIVARHFET